ncbi:uncharacterized protein LOC123560042 [Mercenaria mercenaria]|uniref:uncharacterized protein LOC123560042 n=1 Tax=Mercenaria mercenaria TaxID=6596 RepID=UPI00234F75ED|nr:uncharacterized protein LOC123560042 [Mercenaria mercenaria]
MMQGERNIVLLFAVGILRNTYANNQCPDLVAGPNMKLSETVGWVGDQPVTVTCSEGYVLDTLNLQKNITCIAGLTGAAWSGTIGACNKKECADIETVTGQNMVVTDQDSDHYYFGDNVTVECAEGYAFNVDLTEETDRVTVQKVIYCEEDDNSTYGKWTKAGNCELISCDTPPTLAMSVMVNSNTTFNATTVYQCLSGYGFSTNTFHLTATCNSSAQWSSTFGQRTDLDTLKCTKLRKYIGCRNNGSMVSLSETKVINNGVNFCIDHCKDDHKRFAALHNDTCSCGNELLEGNVTDGNSQCNLLCPGYDVSKPYQHVFCGGSAGQVAVYATLDGCYHSVNLAATDGPEFVTEDVDLTCRERCRGKGFSHAALQQMHDCYCLNTTSISAVETDTNKCQNKTFYNTTQIYDLARKSVYLETCSELFSAGVRMNGDYFFKDKDEKETCLFKDGTVCDEGWIGFDGYCYHFNNESTMNFEDAKHYCISLEADLVSITSTPEFNFLQETRDTFSDLWTDSSDTAWWLGLVDIQNTSLYMWVDGSISTFSNFHEVPKDINKYVAGDDVTLEYKWLEMKSNENHNVMCKKPTEGPHCATIPASSPDYTLVHDTMSVSYCVQICKGQQLQYALIQNYTCNCVHVLPALNAVAKNICISECPGNRFQYCGGDLNTFSVLNVSKKLAARSCEELQLVGIDNNIFLLQEDDTSNLKYCDVAACPFSWIFINGSCYKYMLYDKKIKDAIEMCATEDAYMVTIETKDEIEDVINAANNISLYSSVSTWRVGLLALSLNGGIFRWSNGKIVSLDYWNNKATGLEGTVVRVLASNYRQWEAKSASKDVTQFICEKSTDYKGCFAKTGLVGNVSIHEYNSMTIQQCVEICRVNSRKYAFLNSTSCLCETSLTSERKGKCTSVCSGQDNQICGGSDVMSVYDVDQFPPFASNCSELFRAGIFLSGRYMLSGTEQVCNFTDGTTCNDDDWIGLRGDCYKFFPKGQTSHFQTCRENNAVQTSLTTVDEYDMLVEYVRRINFHGGNARVFTGITHGGYDLDVFISDDGFLTEYNLTANGHLLHLDLHDTYGHISFYIDHSHKHNTDRGVICKDDKYVIGCYEKPSSFLPVLEDFGSVELTLCRQLCVGNGSNITLVGYDFCACATEAELHSFTSTAGAGCEVHCKMPKNQLCGNGSTMWAYHSGIGDFPYADSCSHLYKNGIFYNSTYRLSSSDPSVPFTEAQCGFTDMTECPANWLGYNTLCYRLVKNHATFSSALEHCAKMDSYLFNPVEETSKQFVRNFINTSGLLTDTVWWSGITPVFFNTSYISSHGILAAVDQLLNENRPITHSVFHTDTSVLSANTHDKLPFMCQTDKDFLGCYKITDVPDAHYEDFSGNSLTQCLYWCKGQSYNFAAAHSHNCMCFLDYPAMSEEYGKCNIVCDVGKSQICGGGHANDTVYHSVLNITNVVGTIGSCQHLFNHGIYKPGQYKIRFSDLNPGVQVNCFVNPDPLDYVDPEIKSVSASSTLDGHNVKDMTLIFPFTSAWKPNNDGESEYVKIILTEEHIITGIAVSGLHTQSEHSYLKSYTTEYRDLLTGVLEMYSYNGSTEVSSPCRANNVLCFRFFTEPIVTNEIWLFPKSWHNSVSLQVQLLGQLYTEFNHSETYIGCAADPLLTFTNIGHVSNIEECIILCRGSLVPFASVDNSGDCFCGSGDFDYGFVDDSFCPLTTSGVYHTGTDIYRAIHRTFYKHCGQPNYEAVLHGNITSINSTTNTPYVYTYKTTLVYSCDVGYELPDGTQEQQSYCLQSNNWSKLTENCSVVSCPSFAVDNGIVNFTSLEYEGSATVTCNHGFWTTNGMTQMTVHCTHNKQWSAIPDCSVDNLRHKQRQFTVVPGTVRDKSAAVDEIEVRSRLDCAVRCTEAYYCTATNFKSNGEGADGGTCRLFNEDSETGDLSDDPDWNYVKVFP